LASQGAPPVSTTPAANFATNFTSVDDTGGKFATSINDTGSKFATGVNDTDGKQWGQYQAADTLK
jgi:predicted lactoylglutathione lyase